MGNIMAILLLALLVVILFGAGIALHSLRLAAAAVATVWVAGFAFGRGAGGRRSLQR
jgi:hypothetical protein